MAPRPGVSELACDQVGKPGEDGSAHHRSGERLHPPRSTITSPSIERPT